MMRTSKRSGAALLRISAWRATRAPTACFGLVWMKTVLRMAFRFLRPLPPVVLVARDDEVLGTARAFVLSVALHVIHEGAQARVDEHVRALPADALADVMDVRAARLGAGADDVEQPTVGVLALGEQQVFAVHRLELGEQPGRLRVAKVVDDEAGLGEVRP